MQALIWSKMSTGLPIDISSSMKGQNYTSFCRLDIDIHRYDLNMVHRPEYYIYYIGPYVIDCSIHIMYIVP